MLRVPEPAVLDGRTLAADVLSFIYPDGGRNTEALVVEPGTARLFVVTKALTSLGEVYRLDGLRPGGRGRAVPVGRIAAPAPRDALVTGANVKLSSFGSFQVRSKNERIGRNPKTGEEVPILPRQVLVFKPSNVLKSKINKSMVVAGKYGV